MVTFEYRRFAGKEFEQMPKGDFARIAVNPYNGKIVFCVNDSEATSEVVEEVINQLSHDLRHFRMKTGIGLLGFLDENDGNQKLDSRPASVLQMQGLVGPVEIAV